MDVNCNFIIQVELEVNILLFFIKIIPPIIIKIPIIVKTKALIIAFILPKSEVPHWYYLDI